MFEQLNWVAFVILSTANVNSLLHGKSDYTEMPLFKGFTKIITANYLLKLFSYE